MPDFLLERVVAVDDPAVGESHRGDEDGRGHDRENADLPVVRKHRQGVDAGRGDLDDPVGDATGEILRDGLVGDESAV